MSIVIIRIVLYIFITSLTHKEKHTISVLATTSNLHIHIKLDLFTKFTHRVTKLISTSMSNVEEQ